MAYCVQEESSDKESVREVIENMKTRSLYELPRKYVAPPHIRPRFEDLLHPQSLLLPTICFQDLLTSHTRDKALQDISQACQEWGFFQVVNHHVLKTTMLRMWSGVRSFFQQPPEELRRKYYSRDITKPVAYVSSFNPSNEDFSNWKDTLRLRLQPSSHNNATNNNSNVFDQLPSCIREATKEYLQQHMETLGKLLYEALSESLGMDKGFLESHVGATKAILNVSIHFYPPSPNPEVTVGLRSHSDPNLFTVLLAEEDANIPGLHVNKDEHWVALHTLPNSFLVNIGDQLEILTNGKYKSVVHRVVTNHVKERTSIATFFNPAEDFVMGPLPCFEQKTTLKSRFSQTRYKESKYKDYVTNFYNEGLSTDNALRFVSMGKNEQEHPR